MPINLVRYGTATVASAAFLGSSSIAQATARTPSISGNGWVALVIIVVLVAAVWLLISGALHLERRDAGLGRSVGSKRDRGWFGIFSGNGDDDGNGGEGSG